MAVRDAGLLTDGDLGRLEIISADEREALLGEVERGIRITDLLAGHAADAETASWPLQDCLLARPSLT